MEKQQPAYFPITSYQNLYQSRRSSVLTIPRTCEIAARDVGILTIMALLAKIVIRGYGV
jgi:hypothetical protein